MRRLRVAVLVNGAPGSAMDIRAHGLFEPLADQLEYRILHRSARKLYSIAELAVRALGWRPDVLYVLDAGFSGVFAAEFVGTFRGLPWILDTGDAIEALARSTGMRGRAGVYLTGVLERLALAQASRIVVRGTGHAELLAKQGLRAEVIQDGVSPEQFLHPDGTVYRRAWGLGEHLSIGVLGSSVWSPKLELCYGWELVELLALLRGKPVRGVLIGGGTGIERLERRARECGVEGMIHFAGYVPYASLPQCLGALDVCLSTQSNDVVGSVRTTGKLPLYLASGRYVLASDVGEASRVLPAEMRVPYSGTVDRSYPEKLRDRVLWLLEDRRRLEAGRQGSDIARRCFDYRLLAARVLRVVESCGGGRGESSYSERGARAS